MQRKKGQILSNPHKSTLTRELADIPRNVATAPSWQVPNRINRCRTPEVFKAYPPERQHGFLPDAVALKAVRIACRFSLKVN